MSYNNGPKIATDGLVLSLDAANPKSHPGSGNTWYDLSGRDYHCTMYNSPAYSGSYVGFNGVNHYVRIPAGVMGDNTNNAGSGSITYEVMFYIEPNHPSGSTYHHFLGNFCSTYMALQGSDSSRSFIGMMYSNTHDDPANPNTWPTSTAIATPHSRWLMLTYQHQNDNFVKYYLNGTLMNSIGPYTNFRMKAFAQSGQNLGAGYNLGDVTQFMKGRIAFFRVYNRILSSTEIINNYSAAKGRFGL
jgi:hypothetical protein